MNLIDQPKGRKQSGVGENEQIHSICCELNLSFLKRLLGSITLAGFVSANTSGCAQGAPLADNKRNRTARRQYEKRRH